MTPSPTAQWAAHGRVLAPEVSPTGPAAGVAAGRDTARDGASHARLAELYRALAEAYDELASGGQVQLATGAEPALMSVVGRAWFETDSAAPVCARAGREELLGDRPSTPSTPSEPERPERLLSVRDLADRLGVDPKTVRRWRRDRVLPEALEIAGVIRWRREVVDQWILDREAQR